MLNTNLLEDFKNLKNFITTRKESFYDKFIDDENIFVINKIIYDEKLNSLLIIKYL